MNTLPQVKRVELKARLKVAISIVALLAATWLLTTPVQAQTGLTVEVNRSNNLLIASAVTVEGSEIVDSNWHWAKSEQCNLDLFTADALGDNNERGDGWTVVLDSEDAGRSYCFYAEDSDGRKAVAGSTVVRPVIEIEQNNDQLTARVINAEQDNLVVDQNSWQWYRYHHVEDSNFDCRSELFDLDDGELRQEAEKLQAAQEVAEGENQVNIYEIQKNAYLSGQDSNVDLTGGDQDMNFCFQVSDSAGITNVMRITVGEVIVDNIVGKSGSTEGSSESDVSGEEGAGQISVDNGSISVGDEDGLGSNEEGGSSKVIRNIGLVLLAIAIITGVYMLIKRSQNTEEEEA